MVNEAVHFTDLDDGLPFGARVWGASRDNLAAERNRKAIKEAFEDKGLLIFEEVEQSPQMQLAISAVLGPLKDHPLAAVPRASEELAPGIIDLNSDPNEDQIIVELEGRMLSNWLPWHFDHSYNNELNRAGVLRPMVIAPDGGLTGFADGIDLYKMISPSLRQRIEGLNVIYSGDFLPRNMRFGKPDKLRELKTPRSIEEIAENAKRRPRSIHPAVWTRKNGEKVLHVSALHAVGIENHETPEGDELLRQVCREIASNSRVYHHQWKLGQMLTWDNWRMLHCVSGTHPRNARRMHRTTIAGDYGLGRFEVVSD